MNKIVILLLLSFLLNSCFHTIYKGLQKGNVKQSVYCQEVNFEDILADFIVIKAEVNGVEGKFIFDTGASSILSSSFAQKLNLPVFAKGKIRDSGGNIVKKQAFVILSDVKIGDVNFCNIGANVLSFKASDVFACMDVDGIIGANLMRNAFWEIDYKHKKLIFASDLNMLSSVNDTSAMKVRFDPNSAGVPFVDLNVDNVDFRWVTFDTGSNGNICLMKDLFDLMLRDTVDYTYRVGVSGYGINGKHKSDSTFYSIAKDIRLGDFSGKDMLVRFNNPGNIIGNEFLRNFRVILDWQANTIRLIKDENDFLDRLSNFGFSVHFNDNKLYIGSVYQNSGFEDFGIKIGDQILQIDSFDYRHLSNSDYCECIEKKILANYFEDVDSIRMVLSTNDGEKIFKLHKKNMFYPKLIE